VSIPHSAPSKFSLQKKFLLSILLIITPITGVIFSWVGIRSERSATTQVIDQARILARQIIITRQWIVDCGGVMVDRNSAGAQKVIYFLDDKLKTSRGTFNRFTPAMVTERLSHYSMRENMYHFRLASLNPMNSDNEPDAFERIALQRFIRKDEKEVYCFDENDKERTFRYVVPLHVDQACVECHRDFSRGTVGGCLSFFIPTEMFNQSLKQTYFNLFFAGIAVILLTSTTLFFLLRKLVIKPVSKMKTMATEISDGNHRFRVDIETRDEFEQLGRVFNQMGDQLSRNQEIMQRKINTATLELYQANQDLKKGDKFKTEFIADMSHELRSPVTAIRGGLDYLKRRITEEDHRSYLTIIDNNLLRLTHLISDMLDLTRIEAGKVNWCFERHDMNELIREVIEILSLNAREKGVSLDFHQAGPIWITMDIERIEQVLVNLVENAIKFSPSGSKIVIESRLRDQWVLVSIQDSGIGIAEKDLETIFKKFRTLPSSGGSGQTKGTGLGLTICRKIVEAHRGRIWAESKKGQGSGFYVTLPQGHGDKRDKQDPGARPSPARAAGEPI